MTDLLKPANLLGLSFMFSGLALFIHILTDAPLSVTVLSSFLAAIVFFATLYRLGAVNGVDLRRRIHTGLIAGVVGVIAYDLSRIAVWYLWAGNAWPFEAFRFFGYGLLGQSASSEAALVAGTLFHLCNGLMFAVTFTTWLGSKGRFWALGWALTLEALTLALYPDWLEINRFAEFTQVSIIGHVSYGLALGEVNARRRKVGRKNERLAEKEVSA